MIVNEIGDTIPQLTFQLAEYGTRVTGDTLAGVERREVDAVGPPSETGDIQ